jgi:hypothetical protein
MAPVQAPAKLDPSALRVLSYMTFVLYAAVLAFVLFFVRWGAGPISLAEAILGLSLLSSIVCTVAGIHRFRRYGAWASCLTGCTAAMFIVYAAMVKQPIDYGRIVLFSTGAVSLVALPLLAWVDRNRAL